MRMPDDTLATLPSRKRLNHRGRLSIDMSAGKSDIGRKSVTVNDAYFHIVSNYTGFDPLITHMKQAHILAGRVSNIGEIAALAQVKATSQSLEEGIDFAKERLIKPNATRPRTRKTLTSHVAAMFLKALTEEDVTAVVDGLFKCGCVREDGKRLVYLDECEKKTI